MSAVIYEYHCDECEYTIRINNPENPEWCPACGVRL